VTTDEDDEGNVGPDGADMVLHDLPAANPPPHQKPSKTWNPPTTPHNAAQRNPGMAFTAIPRFSLPSGACLDNSKKRY
jgi:hypothetical protein